ncbi:MAG: SCP2 sterol-binding domain-containing protein [Lachnospiraceae bacterium]|nr:SCP2 sterol-binding domain-containing protein [Lachnospiraceae bacterium]
MDFNTLVSEVREGAQKLDVSGVDFLAVQVNLTDMDPGVFYVEVKDGKVNVEPYEYHDRQCALSISSEDYVKLVTGKLDPVLAFTLGKLKVEGDIGKAIEFSKLLK